MQLLCLIEATFTIANWVVSQLPVTKWADCLIDSYASTAWDFNLFMRACSRALEKNKYIFRFHKPYWCFQLWNFAADEPEVNFASAWKTCCEQENCIFYITHRQNLIFTWKYLVKLMYAMFKMCLNLIDIRNL